MRDAGPLNLEPEPTLTPASSPAQALLGRTSGRAATVARAPKRPRAEGRGPGGGGGTPAGSVQRNRPKVSLVAPTSAPPRTGGTARTRGLDQFLGRKVGASWIAGWLAPQSLGPCPA